MSISLAYKSFSEQLIITQLKNGQFEMNFMIHYTEFATEL